MFPLFFPFFLVLPDWAGVEWGLLAFDRWSHLCPYMHTGNQAGGESSKGRNSLHYNNLVTENAVFTCSWGAIRRLLFWIQGWRVFLGYNMTLQLEHSYSHCVFLCQNLCVRMSEHPTVTAVEIDSLRLISVSILVRLLGRIILDTAGSNDLFSHSAAMLQKWFWRLSHAQVQLSPLFCLPFGKCWTSFWLKSSASCM